MFFFSILLFSGARRIFKLAVLFNYVSGTTLENVTLMLALSSLALADIVANISGIGCMDGATCVLATIFRF